MKCRKFRALMEDETVLDAAMRLHTQVCGECAAEERRLGMLRESLSTWADVPPPAGLAARALAECVTAPVPRRGPMGSRLGRFAAAIGSVAVAALLWTARPAPVIHTSVEVPKPLTASEKTVVLQALARVGDRAAWAESRSRNVLARVARIGSRGKGVE